MDRRILQALQTHGRATYDELAAGVGLSARATQHRVKRLDESGVIAGYVALVAPEQVGLGLTALHQLAPGQAQATHSAKKRRPVDAFAAAVHAWPEVLECAALTGDMDYLLRVLVRDMAHYSRYIMDSLLKHPSVLDCKTSFMMRRLKGTTAMPL